MTRRTIAVRTLALALLLGAWAAPVAAQQPSRAPGSHEHPTGLDTPTMRPNPMHAGDAHAAQHGGVHGAPNGHGAHGEGAAAHAEHDEKAPPGPINWTNGLLGEKEGVEPNLLWRAPGEPPPFLASLINFALLVGIVVRFGKKPLADALSKRKTTILNEIEESQRMRLAAEQRLREYEERLGKMHEELERVHRESREQGQLDKERIVREANERRERMLKDAELLLAQEAKDLRQALVGELVEEATRKATEMLSKQMTLGDHDRFAEAMLTDVRARSTRASGSAPPRGGVS